MFTYRVERENQPPVSWAPQQGLVEAPVDHPQPPRTMRTAFPLAAGLLVFALMGLPLSAEAQSLRGGTASLDRQNRQAELHGFTYIETPEQVRRFVEAGYLVPVRPSRDMEIHNVSFPYARPEVSLFLQRLSAQYRAACGEKLVVTSLTRPRSNQPWNASSRSVHPTGMAVDLRRSARASCRNWLERTLLSLESEGLLEAIYERNPPHYHLAVYPRPYANYVAQRTGNQDAVAEVVASAEEVRTEWVSHRVRSGETLIGISGRYGVGVQRLRTENGIRGSRILVGQELRIPVYRTVTVAANAAESPEVSQEQVQAAAALPSDGGVEATSHRVARGESLWTIARLHGVSEADLRAENGIRGSRILVGQELRIPGEGISAQGGTVRHTVRNGESLWIIARRHGVSVDEIRRRNGISTSRIHPGQVLDVPVSR